jgi:hypothetical protein
LKKKQEKKARKKSKQVNKTKQNKAKPKKYPLDKMDVCYLFLVVLYLRTI